MVDGALRKNNMPIYDITAPDGNTYEITAPEGASESDVMAYAQSEYATPQQEPSYNPDQINRAESLGTGFEQGATFGFADELQEQATTGMGHLTNKLGLSNIEDPRAHAQALRQAELEKMNALQEEHGGYYLGGELAGAVGTAITATPSAVGKGLAYASSKGILPSIAAHSGVGALSGGVYGLGTGEGGTDKRLEKATQYGAMGGAGGLVGLGVSRLAGRAVDQVSKTPLADKARKLIEGRVSQPATQSIEATPQDVKQLSRVGKSDENIFSMSQGQKTQMPKAQRLESDAIAGVLGVDAERAARNAMVVQSRERKALLSQLGDIDSVGDSGDVLEGVFNTIGSQSKKLKGEVNNAYDLARSGGGTKISVDDIKDGLFSRIVKLKKDGQYDVQQMPVAQDAIKTLTRLVRTSKGGRFTSANLSEMEKLRTRITTGVNSTNNGSEKSLLRGMLKEYDGFMYKTANEAVDSADSDAIMAFRDAVSKRREYGMLYESDRFVKDIVTGAKGLDDAVKDLIGTGSIVGKKRMESTYDAIIKAAGDDAGAVSNDLQTAFAKKLLDQSITGLEVGGEQAFLSAAKTKSALEGLFVNNRSFAKKLYGEDVVKSALQAIDELGKISTTQASTTNPSGSGQLVLRQLQKLPLINLVGQSVEASSQAFKAGAANKSFAEIIKGLNIQPKSELFRKAGTTAGGVGAVALTEQESE